MKGKIIKGQLMAAKIFERTYDKKIEIELGLNNDHCDFIESSGSFNAYWLTDLIHVLNQTRLELADESKYKRIVTHTAHSGTVVEYEFRNLQYLTPKENGIKKNKWNGTC